MNSSLQGQMDYILGYWKKLVEMNTEAPGNLWEILEDYWGPKMLEETRLEESKCHPYLQKGEEQGPRKL